MNVVVNSVHPGIVYTDLVRNVLGDTCSWIVKKIMKTPEQGGDTLVYAALDQSILSYKQLYMENCMQVRSSSFSASASA